MTVLGMGAHFLSASSYMSTAVRNPATAMVPRGIETVHGGEKQVPTQERLLYASENGDCWSLCCDPDSGCLNVRHRANLPSGGLVSDITLGEFLMQGGLGPEKQELLRLIGSLVNGETNEHSEPATS